MGDEDEGFDEEFCDSEDPPMRAVPDLPPLNLQELNNTDIQSLLAESTFDESVATVPPFLTTSLLDDIDPGVSMLEAESSTQSLFELEQGKTSPLHSPFPISTPSPMCAGVGALSVGDVGMFGLPPVDDWNTYPMYGGHYPASSADASDFSSAVNVCTPTSYLLPPASPSMVSPSPPPHSSGSGPCFELDMLTSMCTQSPVSDPHHTLTAHSPSPIPSYQHRPANYPHSLASSPSPSLPPTTPPPATPPHHYITSSPNFQYCSNYEYNPLPNGQSKLAKGCTGGAGCGPGTTTNTNSFSSCATQTPIRTSSPAPLSPAPSPSLATNSSTSSSNSSDDIPKTKPVEKIVHMPFYQFKRILDSPSIPEEKKNNIKTVRRRGKNKIAAKMCRQRKKNLVMGLEQEIDTLRALKMEKASTANALLREIEHLKNTCAAATYHHNRQRTCH